MSIEVLDGEFPARLWMEARGDQLVEVALACHVIEWNWEHFAGARFEPGTRSFPGHP